MVKDVQLDYRFKVGRLHKNLGDRGWGSIINTAVLIVAVRLFSG